MENFKKKVEEEKFKVRCVTCASEVDVEITPFGGGYIASNCPKCGKLAYNSKEKPTPNQNLA